MKTGGRACFFMDKNRSFRKFHNFPKAVFHEAKKAENP